MPETPLSSSYPVLPAAAAAAATAASVSIRPRRDAARAALCRFLRPLDMHCLGVSEGNALGALGVMIMCSSPFAQQRSIFLQFSERDPARFPSSCPCTPWQCFASCVGPRYLCFLIPAAAHDACGRHLGICLQNKCLLFGPSSALAYGPLLTVGHRRVSRLQSWDGGWVPRVLAVLLQRRRRMSHILDLVELLYVLEREARRSRLGVGVAVGIIVAGRTVE